MDNSFRTAQAVSDLVHHVKPLLALHLAVVARASGLTLAQTGAAFRALRDDGFRFQRDATFPLLDGLKSIAITQGEGFELALVVLLADNLQSQRTFAQVADAWGAVVRRLRDGPATLRAAAANGLVRAGDVGIMRLSTHPTAADCLTRDAATIAEPLLQIARSMRQDELMSVAAADYGRDVEHHLGALRSVIGQRDGIFLPEDYWYPSKVVELTSHSAASPGYAGCTAILLLNALKIGDRLGWFSDRWSGQGAAYCALQPSRRDPILAAVRYLYESDRHFMDSALFDSAGRLGEGATLPVVTEL
jgi:hypothetical protein